MMVNLAVSLLVECLALRAQRDERTIGCITSSSRQRSQTLVGTVPAGIETASLTII